MHQLKLCLRNKEFLFTGMGTGGIIVFANVWSTVFSQLISPYGITNDEFFTTLGITSTSVGIFGGLAFAAVLTRYPKLMNSAASFICITTMIVLGYFYYADIIADKT